MERFTVNRAKVKQIGKQHLNLVYNQSVFSEYINQAFDIKGFERQMNEKKQTYSHSHREVLVDVLKQQYASVSNNGGGLNLIESLNYPETFTITTGHQLSLFTGPLYFVLKILHVIKLAEKLNAEFPDKKFVPIYWMASEDHDFEEIQSMNLFGKKITWGSEQQGPVGRFKLEGLDEIKADIKEMFSNHPESSINSLIDSYSGKNLAEATRNLVHHLFENFNLVIIDGDNAQLKSLFAPVIKKELLSSFSHNSVLKTNIELTQENVKIQVNPREINLFYILDGVRTRITKEKDQFHIEGVGNFSEDEILNELDFFPERFSPNVILRPLYQEVLLPNLAYVGGAGELSYWIQLKDVFDKTNCTFPMISIRNSVMWIDSPISKKMSKINLELDDLFESKDALKKNFVTNNSEGKLDFTTLDEMQKDLSNEIEKVVTSIEPSMAGMAESEVVKLKKQLENLKSKLVRTSKSKHDSELKAIDQIIDKLFPGGGLQERSVNFFSFSPDGDFQKLIESLYAQLDPEEKDLIVIKD